MLVTAEQMEVLKQKHEKFLYPIVRVSTDKGTGSGTIVYCGPDSENPGDFVNLVLTNNHVIEAAVKVEKRWNSILKRNMDTEITEPVSIETFQYNRLSDKISANKYYGQVVAWDKDHDLALLKIESPLQNKHLAQIIPKDKIQNLHLFMDVVVAGCSLGADPFCNTGQITDKKYLIENKAYVMNNASSIFGNSGGALFLADSGYMIGVPSRITVTGGFTGYAVTWMGYAAHPSRLHDFLEHQEFGFVCGCDTHDYREALKRREKKTKDSALELKAELAKEE